MIVPSKWMLVCPTTSFMSGSHYRVNGTLQEVQNDWPSLILAYPIALSDSYEAHDNDAFSTISHLCQVIGLVCSIRLMVADTCIWSSWWLNAGLLSIEQKLNLEVCRL